MSPSTIVEPTLRTLRVALAMPRHEAARFFSAHALAELRQQVILLDDAPIEDFSTPRARRILAQVDALVTTWGCPVIDQEVVDDSPHLRAIIHAGGSVKHHVTEAVWNRGIAVSSAAAANAVPVAEYTLASILLAGKSVIPIAAMLKERQGGFDPERLFPGMGNFEKRVGIVGASKIGRRVLDLLRPFGFDVVLADPFVSKGEATTLGARLVSLDELLATSDIISLHVPSLPETRHMIGEVELRLMGPGTTLINTSRGELIDQDALVRRVRAGDLFAILDVTTPWTLPLGHPLYDSPNVFLTPHIAGSLGTELHRLAESAIEEVSRFAAGQPLRHEVHSAELSTTA